jgi:hypothetical protein
MGIGDGDIAEVEAGQIIGKGWISLLGRDRVVDNGNSNQIQELSPV